LNKSLDESEKLEKRCKFLGYDIESKFYPPTKEIQEEQEQFRPYSDFWNLVSNFCTRNESVLKEPLRNLAENCCKEEFVTFFNTTVVFKKQFETLWEERGGESPENDIYILPAVKKL